MRPQSKVGEVTGNSSTIGRQHYDRTKIDTAKDKRWFCTEAETIAAIYDIQRDEPGPEERQH